MFCSTPGRKPGTSTKVMIGMLKASQKRTNRLLRRLDVEGARQDRRLVCHHSDRVPVQAPKSHDDVLRPHLVDLEELTPVEDGLNELTMSYGWFAESGIIELGSRRCGSGRSVGAK